MRLGGADSAVSRNAPAFIHVDVDDYWAIAECYGLSAADQWKHHITETALPIFRELFRELGITATFFVVGCDLESDVYTEQIQALQAAGHRFANHSYSHNLRFRALNLAEMQSEITRCHQLIESRLNVSPKGFRAPGYAASRTLTAVLDQLGYKYDASMMPSPYGTIFRWIDGRLARTAYGHAPGQDSQPKTQYPLLRDTFHSLRPAAVAETCLFQIPSATSPLLRLPFQAGVCMRLGWSYFRACYEPFRQLGSLPFLFLFHAADLADFSVVPEPFFRESSFFNKPVNDRLDLARRFLRRIQADRSIITTEEWLA